MKKQYHDSALQEHASIAAEPAINQIESTSVDYQYKETRELIQLVREAADLVHIKGEAAFSDFSQPGSRWQMGESYIFVLDPEGNMLVHPDPELKGKNQLELKDINGKPIIRGLLAAATAQPDKQEGWYHYEWPVPGGLLPRWKSSFVQLIKSPSGKSYIVGSGMYNDRMERVFVVDMVKNAVAEIMKNKEEAFRLFHDPKGPFRVKDTYVFVLDMDGVEVVNPGFPNIEGSNQLELKDTQGKYLNREMLQLVKTVGSGWVDYMWPKPGESISTQKSTYVTKVKTEDGWLLVGCGVYLANAPKETSKTKKMTASELMDLVREAAVLLGQNGEKAFPEFRKKGSKWLHDDIYFWVWSMDGIRVLHAEKPSGEGQNVSGLKDTDGRLIGKQFLELAASPQGEGWVHCMWPEPFNIFPTWKSCFVKRVTFPSGKQYLTGSGVYNMKMDKNLIEDLVNRASELVAERGKDAFPQLRDKTGPFVFMDCYVFVDNLEGVELVNAGHPSMEGKNLMSLADLNGKYAARDYIEAAVKNGSAWVDYKWYRPGSNEPANKQTFVRKVLHGKETYIVGAGLYQEGEEKMEGGV